MVSGAGERPSLKDWETHLTTIFPEVRLKRYMEMRGADGGPVDIICALPAFWAGLLYDKCVCPFFCAVQNALRYSECFAEAASHPEEHSGAGLLFCSLAAQTCTYASLLGERTLHAMCRVFAVYIMAFDVMSVWPAAELWRGAHLHRPRIEVGCAAGVPDASAPSLRGR